MNDLDEIKHLRARIAELEEEIAKLEEENGVLHLRLASEARLEHGEEGRIQELEEEIRQLRSRNAELEEAARGRT
jgi:cell division protein FtsB